MKKKSVLVASAMVVTTLLLAGGASLLATSDPARAAFPGKNGAIAFSREGFLSQVYTMKAHGSGQTRLTSDATTFDGTWNAHVEWSPDGKKIAFTHGWYRYLDSEIYLMNADGSGVVNLTNDAAWDSDPSWFPTGEKIAYSRDQTTDGSGDLDLYTLSFDALGNRNQLTQLTMTPNAWEKSPAVSPDGTKIAFERTLYLSNGPSTDVYVMNADGTGETNLTGKTATSEGSPDWSPDGTKIAYTRYGSGKANIYVMNADGTGKTNLTKTPNIFEDDPAFSPDGRNMVFSSDKDGGDYDIWRMRIDGSNQTQLTDDPADSPLYETNPDWQPLP